MLQKLNLKTFQLLETLIEFKQILTHQYYIFTYPDSLLSVFFFVQFYEEWLFFHWFSSYILTQIFLRFLSSVDAPVIDCDYDNNDYDDNDALSELLLLLFQVIFFELLIWNYISKIDNYFNSNNEWWKTQ